MSGQERTQTGESRTLADNAPLVVCLRLLYTGGAGINQGSPFQWNAKDTLLIGRKITASQESARGLFVDDARVSRQHAQLHSDGARILISDLASKNGTRVNGQIVLNGAVRALADGDLIEIGDSSILFRREPALLHDARIPPFIGTSVVACRLRHALARCADPSRPVLLLGETGTGKGLAARALHERSGRPGKLVTVNCAAVPSSLAEGLFFGVRRGAYTGAVEHAGLFGEAHQGTLFLDEVGELAPELQAKLLLALESREVRPLGSTRPVSWDVRVLAATNRDLHAARSAGSFREDLFARLAGTVITLPSLRERKEDLLLLARYLAGRDLSLSPRLVAALLRHDWPHNVRELGHVVAQLLDGESDEVLRRLEDKPAPSPPRCAGSSEVPAAGSGKDGSPPLWRAGEPVPSPEQLSALLTRHHGSLRRIEILHGYPRRQLRRWAERYGLDLQRYRNSAAEPS